MFNNIAHIASTDELTVILTLKNPNPDFLFQLGQTTASIVEPKSVAGNNTQPVGTGPYKLESWNKGSSVVLARWDGYRDAKAVKLKRVTIRFIGDTAAQVASLLSGDVDAFPRVAAARSLAQFQNDKRFQVLIGGSRSKTILAINNKRKPLDDVRVRRAIAMALDRKAVIEGAADGFGTPIGSFYVPGAPGYVDLTAVNAYAPDKSRMLLKEAGVATPLELSIKLPPTPYARQGGEVIAAQLAKVGIQAKLENVEWAQWMSGVYGQKAYDLTVIAHVEPLDFGNFARPGYYWNYESPKFNELWAKVNTTADTAQRNQLLADAQRLVADDAVAAYLYQNDLDHGGQGRPEGPVEGRADPRQRPVGAVVAMTRWSRVTSALASAPTWVLARLTHAQRRGVGLLGQALQVRGIGPLEDLERAIAPAHAVDAGVRDVALARPVQRRVARRAPQHVEHAAMGEHRDPCAVVLLHQALQRTEHARVEHAHALAAARQRVVGVMAQP